MINDYVDLNVYIAILVDAILTYYNFYYKFASSKTKNVESVVCYLISSASIISLHVLSLLTRPEYE